MRGTPYDPIRSHLTDPIRGKNRACQIPSAASHSGHRLFVITSAKRPVPFAGSLSRAPGEDVGTYALLSGSLAPADNTPFLAANYELSFTDTVTFAVATKNASTFTVGAVGPFEYSGAAHTPEPTVHDGATLLVKDADYTLSHADNTSAGTATVTVTGIGNYGGSQGDTFAIDRKTLTVTPDTGQSKTFGSGHQQHISNGSEGDRALGPSNVSLGKTRLGRGHLSTIHGFGSSQEHNLPSSHHLLK